MCWLTSCSLSRASFVFGVPGVAVQTKNNANVYCLYYLWLDTFSMIQYMTISWLRHANMILSFLQSYWSSQSWKWLCPKWQKCHSKHQTLFIHIGTWRPQWDYFGSTLWLIALYMIQFAGAFFSENDLCTLEFSILVKMLHNIFGHNTDYEICLVFCFAACLTATILHDSLRDKFLV